MPEADLPNGTTFNLRFSSCNGYMIILRKKRNLPVLRSTMKDEDEVFSLVIKL
ncbi:MAG: hypothetical protein ACE5GU_10115 [Candidatus Scalinduaceae bacterium]